MWKFFVALTIGFMGILFSTDDKYFPIVLSSSLLIFISGIGMGHISGKKKGMKEASKQCQLQECPYVVKDSTQIYLE